MVVTLCLQQLFRPDGPRMSIYQTAESEVVPVRDYIIPMRNGHGHGLRVVADSSGDI